MQTKNIQETFLVIPMEHMDALKKDKSIIANGNSTVHVHVYAMCVQFNTPYHVHVHTGYPIIKENSPQVVSYTCITLYM